MPNSDKNNHIFAYKISNRTCYTLQVAVNWNILHY